MFTRFETDFAKIETQAALPGAMVSLASDTMVETEQGFVPVSQLKAGDRVATLDGGFAELAWVSDDHNPTAAYYVPARALGNCAAMMLPETTQIGIEAPLGYDASCDHLSLPIAAFEGRHGICRAERMEMTTRTLGFEAEEMIWTQTGLLTHAQAVADPFFETMNFAEARGFLALLDADHYAENRAA